MTTATLEIYLRMVSDLLPTLNKPHYTFHLRDISRVFQGVLQVDATPYLLSTPHIACDGVHDAGGARAPRHAHACPCVHDAEAYMPTHERTCMSRCRTACIRDHPRPSARNLNNTRAPVACLDEPQTQKAYYDTRDSVIRLWAHECCRVFCDRVTTDADRQLFLDVLNEKLNAVFNVNLKHLFFKEGMVTHFGDFMRDAPEGKARASLPRVRAPLSNLRLFSSASIRAPLMALCFLYYFLMALCILSYGGCTLIRFSGAAVRGDSRL